MEVISSKRKGRSVNRFRRACSTIMVKDQRALGNWKLIYLFLRDVRNENVDFFFFFWFVMVLKF